MVLIPFKRVLKSVLACLPFTGVRVSKALGSPEGLKKASLQREKPNHLIQGSSAIFKDPQLSVPVFRQVWLYLDFNILSLNYM
jgi:hypothetical protein